MQDLDGIIQDYKNLVLVFYKHFGYSIAFHDNENKLHYCNKKAQNNNNNNSNNSNNNSKVDIKQTKLSTSKFQLKWTEDDVCDFVDEITEIISTGEHDSLLFFISSHGDSDGVILSSDCDEISLFSIFAQFFGDKCGVMLDRPKIFFVDACRGSMRSRVKISTSRNTKSLKKTNSTKTLQNGDSHATQTFKGREETGKSNNPETNETTNNDNNEKNESGENIKKERASQNYVNNVPAHILKKLKNIWV